MDVLHVTEYHRLLAFVVQGQRHGTRNRIDERPAVVVRLCLMLVLLQFLLLLLMMLMDDMRLHLLLMWWLLLMLMCRPFVAHIRTMSATTIA